MAALVSVFPGDVLAASVEHANHLFFFLFFGYYLLMQKMCVCALGQEAAALAWEGQVGEKPPTPSTLKEWPSCPQVKSITRGEQVKPETAQSQRLPPGRCLLRLLH